MEIRLRDHRFSKYQFLCKNSVCKDEKNLRKSELEGNIELWSQTRVCP